VRSHGRIIACFLVQQKDRPKAGSNLTAAGAARGPIGAIDRMKTVCLISATRRKYQMRIALTVAVSATLLAALSEPRTSQSVLYIQGYRGAAAHCRARDQKSTGASRSGSDLSNVEGPDAADHRGRGYRRRRRRANLLLYVRDNAGVGVRAAHDELVERRDDLFHRSRASFRHPQCLSLRAQMSARCRTDCR
jgi:hypothetical protein